MAFVIISHPVADFNHWKSVYDQDVERRTGAGLKEVIAGQDSNDPNMVYMIYETANPGVLQQMLSDPNMAEAMKEAGVTGPPTMVIVE